jgi:hypothetical protein
MNNERFFVGETHFLNFPVHFPNAGSESDENSTVASENKAAVGTWNEGSDKNLFSSITTRMPADLNEVITDAKESNHGNENNENDSHRSAKSAREAADQMIGPNLTKLHSSSRRFNRELWQIFSAKNYTHCCAAGSVTLLGLSVACFVLPSVSNYAAERIAVQAVGYTGGVLSLLFGIGSGLCVRSIYSRPDDSAQ